MAKAFISYSSKDMRIVLRLTNDLITRSPVSVFFAPWDISAGESLIEKIQAALLESDFFIPLLSTNFLASEWAKRELNAATNLAINKKIIVLPVKIDKCEVPSLLTDIKYIDFVDKDYDTALGKLVEALMPGKNPLWNLDCLTDFLGSGEHTPQSLVTLAKQVLETSWTPEDDKGKGAQLIAKKLDGAGHLQQVLEVYDVTLKKFSKVQSLYLLRSSVHRRLNNFSQADVDCAQVLDLDPQNVRALLSRFWVNHDWANQAIPIDEIDKRKSLARICLEKLETVPAAKTTYVHGYIHALAQGAALLRDSSFADEAKGLLEEKEKILYERRGKDRDAVLKAFKILEGFHREGGKPEIAKILRDKRAQFEDRWGRFI